MLRVLTRRVRYFRDRPSTQPKPFRSIDVQGGVLKYLTTCAVTIEVLGERSSRRRPVSRGVTNREGVVVLVFDTEVHRHLRHYERAGKYSNRGSSVIVGRLFSLVTAFYFLALLRLSRLRWKWYNLSLCKYNREAFSNSGNTVLASPPLGSKITIV